MIRRFVWRSRRRLRRFNRQVLDVLDPPEPVPVPSRPATLRPVHAEQTPNPLAVRYTWEGAPPPADVAARVQAVHGVSDVFRAADFLTVTRTSDADADAVHQAVVRTLALD